MDHQHGASRQYLHVSLSLRRALAAAVGVFLLVTIVGLVVLWPSGHRHRSSVFGPPVKLVNATVTNVVSSPCGPARCDVIFLQVTSGPDAGSSTLINTQETPGIKPYGAGDRLVLGRSTDPTGRVTYYISDYQRRVPLLALAALFAVVVVALGRWRGLAALAGLAVTVLVLALFTLPAIADGRDATAVALVTAAVILLFTLYVAHGASLRTTTALLGTLSALALTAVLSAVFVNASHLTGLSSDEATVLPSAGVGINLRGLILAGAIIGALGVINDATVTQASSVWELRLIGGQSGFLRLYRSAMRIGRDHIASTIYTLVLAYAGAALPLLLTFTLANRHLVDVLSGDLVAEEIVRTLVGSIGLVASVPLTTALAAFIVTRAAGPPPTAPEVLP